MESSQQQNTSAQGAIRMLQALHGLTLQAALAESKQSLVFQILNNTISVIRYNRAYLFDLTGRAPTLMGVSGETSVNNYSPSNSLLKTVAASIRDKNLMNLLSGKGREGELPEWKKLDESYKGLSAIWVPIFSRGRLVAAMWLERWNGEGWLEDELPLLNTIARGYGAAWEKFEINVPLLTPAVNFLKNRNAKYYIAAAILVLLLFPVRLRVVAPCEVVPDSPLTVTSPIDGVIKEVLVSPGEEVVAGQALFRYESERPLKELNIAVQQVRIIKSQLERAEADAFDNEKIKADVMVLRHRLRQEMIREKLARNICDNLVVKTPISGVVQIRNPRDWEGQQLRIGDAVLRVMDPVKTRVRVYIPEADNIMFDRKLPVTVLLNVDPSRSYKASISHISESASFSPSNVNSFVCESDWLEGEGKPRLGLQGTAVLYGGKVSLGYWLFRRPLSSIRRLLGV